jgi:hypothetical protein
LQYFQTCIFKENFNKILMQCSHSKHVNIIQTWNYNCNKTKLVCIDASITSIKTLLSNLKKHLSKPIFISHHVICSLISSCCCNHLNRMFMNVKSIVIQLELNDINYKLIFHSYSKFASITWYTFIWKFEKYKPNPKKLHGYDHI